MLRTIGGVGSGDRHPTATTRPRWTRLLVAGLGCVLAAACTASTDPTKGTGTSQASVGPTQRDYWPTAGWRTAAPDRQGMDPAVLDDLDELVPDSYPQVRSVLVVRHGHLVYGGRWDGAQVVPADYVAASTRPQRDPSQGYGYQWWVTNESGHDSFRAEGFGGQLIQVVPDLDLVVVITSDADQRRPDAADLVGAVIVSAVTG